MLNFLLDDEADLMSYLPEIQFFFSVNPSYVGMDRRLILRRRFLEGKPHVCGDEPAQGLYLDATVL